ncbi:hypothetical protein FQZ97_1159010 [compost metagenome]
MPGSSWNKALSCCQSSGTSTQMISARAPMNSVKTIHTARPWGSRRRSSRLTSPCMRKASTSPASTGASMLPRVRTMVKPRTRNTASTTASSSEK